MEKDESKALIRLLLNAYEKAYRNLLIVNALLDRVPNAQEELLIQSQNPVLLAHVESFFRPLYLALDKDDAQDFEKALLDMPTKGPPI